MNESYWGDSVRHACEEGVVLGLVRYANLDDFALLQATWQGLLGDVELHPIPRPVEALNLAGDQGTDLNYFRAIGIGSNPYCTHAHRIIIMTDMLHMVHMHMEVFPRVHLLEIMSSDARWGVD